MEQPQKNTTSLEYFTEVLMQLTDVVKSLTEIEEQKAEAAAGRRHDLINNFLNPEQAQILKLRGLEQKRIQLAGCLGWKGLTFRQILEQADSSQRALLTPCFIQLNRQIKRLTQAREASDKIIRLRLRELKTALDCEGTENFDSGNQTAADAPLHFHDKYV